MAGCFALADSDRSYPKTAQDCLIAVGSLPAALAAHRQAVAERTVAALVLADRAVVVEDTVVAAAGLVVAPPEPALEPVHLPHIRNM